MSGKQRRTPTAARERILRAAGLIDTSLHRLTMPDFYADFLATLLWDHFVTLTFRSRVGISFAWREYENRFIRGLTRLALNRVPWFACIERDAVGDRIHIHAFTAGTKLLHTARIEECWRAGRADVRVYDPRRGAACYVTKTLYRDDAEYDFSSRLPRAA